MFKGNRFFSQVSTGAHRASFHVTPEYRSYVKSLPPEDQLDLIDTTIKDINRAYTRYNESMHFPPSTFRYNYDSFYNSGKPYSFTTHRPQYYK